MVNWFGGKIRNAELFIIIACSVAVILALIMYSEAFPDFNEAIKSMSNGMATFGIQNGLWAAFLLSMFGNTSVFLVIPYAYIIWALALAAGPDPSFTAWYPIILGIISGLGAGVGEVTSYIVGRLFGKSEKMVNSELGQKFDRMRDTFEKHPKMIPFIIFLFAVTPLPDDAILVPFGVMKYSYWKTIIPCMLGKMCLCILTASAGFFMGGAIQSISWLSWIVPDADSNPGDDMLSLLPLFIIVYLMIRVDFEKLLNRSKKPKVTDQAAPEPVEAIIPGPPSGGDDVDPFQSPDDAG
nr:VTT domain-containing protein [Candidatus Sigynarchaeota archaeon]